MKLMSVLVSLCTILSSNTVFASAAAVCGKAVDLDNYAVTEGFEFAISAEDDDFNGPVGSTWFLKLGKNGATENDSEWIENDSNIIGSMSKVKKGSTNISVTIKPEEIGQPTIKYVLYDLYYDGVLKLEKYENDTLVGTYDCASAID